MINQPGYQQLAHQLAQVICRIHVFAVNPIITGKKIAIKAGEPTSGKVEDHGRIGLFAGNLPALAAVNDRQFINPHRLRRFAELQPRAAFQQPQQR